MFISSIIINPGPNFALLQDLVQRSRVGSLVISPLTGRVDHRYPTTYDALPIPLRTWSINLLSQLSNLDSKNVSNRIIFFLLQDTDSSASPVDRNKINNRTVESQKRPTDQRQTMDALPDVAVELCTVKVGMLF